MNDRSFDPRPGDEPTTRLPLDDDTLVEDLHEHDHDHDHELEPEQRPARRTHIGYLLSALFFLAVAAFWAVAQMLVVDVDDAALLAAGTLIAVGGLTLITWWATALRR